MSILHFRRLFLPLILASSLIVLGVGTFNFQNSVEAQTAPVVSAIPLDQKLRFERFTLENGLSQNTVFTMLQDHTGYLWIGTQDGLDRYDGYNFKVFKHDPQNANSLSLSSVIALHEDHAGILWIGTWGGGLNRYDPETGQFIRYQHDPSNPGSINNDIVTSIFEDTAGRMWVGTCGGGLEIFDPQKKQFTAYLNDPANPSSLSSNYVSQIFEDSSSVLWVGTGCFSNPGAGLNRMEAKVSQPGELADVFNRVENNPSDPGSISSNNISAIAQGPDGALWAGTGGYALEGNGLNRIDPQTGQITRFLYNPEDPASLSNNTVMGLLVDSNATLWVSTWGGGLDLVSLAGQGSGSTFHFSIQRNNPYDSLSISSDITWSFLEDRSGIIWIGTGNGGLDKLDPQKQRFGLYRNDPGDPKSLITDVVGRVLQDSEGRIWVSTLGGGLELFDRETGTFKHYVQSSSDPLSQQANTYMDIYQDNSETLWTGTLAGLGQFDPITGKTIFYRHDDADPKSLVNNNVSSITEDYAGRLWIGTLAGLDWFDNTSKQFIHMQIPELVSVFKLYLDQDGSLWVGSWGQGLFHLNLGTVNDTQITYTRFVNNPTDPTSLADNGVLDILRDKRGTLWLGTQAGLDRFDPKTKTFTHFQEQDGLVNNTVLCMLEDQQGTLWVSTNGGISHFTPSGSSFRNFDVNDGLQSNEFDSGGCGVARDGEMYFGGQKGLSVFLPQAIQNNPVAPPVALTAFEVFNEPVSVDLTGKTPIKLSYAQGFIAFDFVGLDFHAPQKNQYTYMLEGVDKDWVKAGTRRYASYTNLPGGDYVFRVRASNSDGVWNDTGASVPIAITPPIWQTWWFRAASIFALMAIVYMGVRWRVENIRTAALQQTNEKLQQAIDQREKAETALAQKAAEEAVVAERTRLARDLHDAVTQTLFSASLLAEVIPQLWEINQTEALKRLGELKELTRGALAEMRTLLLELRPSALTDTALPDLLRQLNEAVIGRGRVPVQLTIDGDCSLPPEVQVAFYRIAQETLNNVLKYAKASQVIVNLRTQANSVRLSIVDDGVGFDVSAVPANHLGLRIMRERAEAIGARLNVISEPGKGTQVTVNWIRPN